MSVEVPVQFLSDREQGFMWQGMAELDEGFEWTPIMRVYHMQSQMVIDHLKRRPNAAGFMSCSSPGDIISYSVSIELCLSRRQNRHFGLMLTPNSFVSQSFSHLHRHARIDEHKPP